MFEKSGEFKCQIGCKGEDPGQLMYPYGIAVDADDNIYVCDLGKWFTDTQTQPWALIGITRNLDY